MVKIADLVEQYGALAKDLLNGPGEPEAALSQPVTELIIAVSNDLLQRKTVMHREVREDSGTVRPDYGARVDGLMTGHVELKKPGTSLDPSTYAKTSHNARQWQRLSNLPNLLHTNGTDWRLWRFGELIADSTLHTPSLATHKGKLTAPASFLPLITDFLTWTPTPITSVGRLVDTIAPLAVMLREEVLESLKADRRFAKANNIDPGLRPFIGLHRDWRASLYPRATDEEFADGFAQTVVFALVVGLSEGIELEGLKIPEIASRLKANHTLLGRALDLLTEHVAESTVGLAIETIVRALSAARWQHISQGRQDVYLHLYEHFLSAYNPERRKQSGSFYTPVEVVDSMTRLTDEALKKYLNTPEGLSADTVAVIDPAMGTGTYPLSVLRQVADNSSKYGQGAVSDAVTSAAQRLYGIELQSGPFSVAELRLTQAIRDYGGSLPDGGLNLYVADTLEDPKSGSSRQLSYTLQLIAEQRQRANKMKVETPIQVCIGNPPYKDKSEGLGGWIELGDPNRPNTPLDDFRLPGNGKFEYVLKNLYVYFWRWAMWKVFESTPASHHGVVCFITATGYLNGPGFRGMRQWIRENTSRGWIINLTPEGKQPPANTAVFNIETPVSIALFIRDQANDPTAPSEIKYTELHGLRKEKFGALDKLNLSDASFTLAGSDWTDGFVPAAGDEWTAFPALNDLFPWTAPGIKPNKTWVYNPNKEILEQRWNDLILEDDKELKAAKFKETSSTGLHLTKKIPLIGSDTEQNTQDAFDSVAWPTQPSIVHVGYRSFDRQHIIADSRLLHRASPDLWAARSKDQVFMVEQHAHEPGRGPGIMLSHLIPDMDYFNNRGGRVLPMLNPDGSPNVALDLLDTLSEQLGADLTVDDLFAYVAGISAHPGYVERFSDEVKYGANRVPITSDLELWSKTVDIGRLVLWLHTFGERGVAPLGATSILDHVTTGALPSYDVAVSSAMPETATYEPLTQTISLGSGQWSNVDPRVWSYAVGGREVIESWIGYRRKKPKGKRTSPLNDLVTTNWPSQWSREFSELLAVLTHLVHLEEQQADLLEQVLDGPILSVSELEDMGVQWPKVPKDRKPRMAGDLF
ncbi:putative site-specific DNA-methyltransferase (adenine specific) [Glutamicibacter arilaitensis Re117]|uniref:site-specific DNA-methyltransferase (adenine-specific) n=1 Tax=Glutamicibacter arilaitensis (strain DSM 16368 / CIP 108037 / IAM 15318 / JCM 13566 / NCIMB 14258 / Re117) TaxID=861360 RepID=A0ABM9Q0Q9_GLUAR|nr:type ISP restriction/modification enzyme [Glutamicibacter arilaitensis]CBT77241.1 putative site-specific DNA-methyltransferase (adenine specific) [Glutamicibacter arilaitensis Re117]